MLVLIRSFDLRRVVARGCSDALVIPTMPGKFDNCYALKEHISREMMNHRGAGGDSGREGVQWLEVLLSGGYDPDEDSAAEPDVDRLENFVLLESTVPQDFALAQSYSWVPLGDALWSTRCSSCPLIVYRLLEGLLRERATGMVYPELPSFVSRAFRTDMHKWIARSLKELGHFSVEPFKMDVVYTTETKLFLSDDTFYGSFFYCKVLHSPVNEAAITGVVSQLFPDLVVRPLSVNVRQNIILSRNFGKSSQDECDSMECQANAEALRKECRKKAVEAMTFIHVQSIRFMPKLKASGLFANTGIDMIKKDYCPFIKHLKQHRLVSDETFRKLEATSWKVEALCEEVKLAGIPSVLCHGDLGLHNLTCPQREEKRRLIFDWGEATISHPFFDIAAAHGRWEPDVRCFSSWSKHCDEDIALRAYRGARVLFNFWHIYKRLWPSVAVKSFLLSREYRADILDDISYFLREADAWTLSDEHSHGKGRT